MAESGNSASDLLVIFGITGDLARKMTFQALYRLERKGLLQCPIVGVASEDISVEELVTPAMPCDGLKDSLSGVQTLSQATSAPDTCGSPQCSCPGLAQFRALLLPN